MSTTRHVWLTQDSYNRLQAELATLRGHRGANVDDHDTTATDPDQAYIADADRRRERVRQIQHLLDHAIVDEMPPDDGVAEPGMVLTVRFDDDAEAETFLLGARDGMNVDTLEVYSPDSPLGAALTGARQGDQRTYRAPNGTTVQVTLVAAVPYARYSQRQE